MDSGPHSPPSLSNNSGLDRARRMTVLKNVEGRDGEINPQQFEYQSRNQKDQQTVLMSCLDLGDPDSISGTEPQHKLGKLWDNLISYDLGNLGGKLIKNTSVLCLESLQVFGLLK